MVRKEDTSKLEAATSSSVAIWLKLFRFGEYKMYSGSCYGK